MTNLIGPVTRDLRAKTRDNLREYIVTYIFILISVVFVIYSGRPMSDILNQLMGRLSRNLFIVLALIIPIIAGMGINFAITIGAMAAQVGLILAINWNVTGLPGLLLAAAITLPLGLVLGYLIGSLLNKMKGQETIGSMILGYFANGAYQLLFLFIFGKLIPLAQKVTIVGATGVANTLNLTGDVGLYYVLDGMLQISFSTALYIVCAVLIVGALGLYFAKQMSRVQMLKFVILAVLSVALYMIPAVQSAFAMIKVPVVTFAIVALLCLFNVAIMKTRLGQKFRAVGQSRTVANASGINVNRVRIIALMISTVFAGWGQIIFIQNLGTLQTYSQHEMVGLYAGAAILVGGASLDKATNGQAIVGCFLFHLLFIVAQDAGRNLLGDPNIGEFFRVFVSYGVIAVALVMHAWRKRTIA